MVQKKVTVENKLGLHARPCSLLVKAANHFRSEIKISKDDMEVNGKSIIGVMTLAASQGTELILIADGADEEYALEKLASLFEEKFDED